MMWARHPAIARRWAKKYGSTPVNRGNSSSDANRAQKENRLQKMRKLEESRRKQSPQSSQGGQNSPAYGGGKLVPLPQIKQRPSNQQDSDYAAKRQQMRDLINRRKR